MNNFLRKTKLFFSLPIIFTLFFIFCVTQVSNSYKTKDNITDLYAGDSHMEAAIDDKIVAHSKNISKGGETFYFTYYKLKSLIEKNQKIEKVFIAVSYHNLSSKQDVLTNGNRSYFYAAPYFYILPLKEKIRVVGWNLNHLNAFCKNVFKYGVETIFKVPSFIGSGYTNESKSKASNRYIEERILDVFYSKDSIAEFSDINIEYLKKINELCKNQNIALYTVNLPLHPDFLTKVPNKFSLKLNELMKKEEIKFIDFKNFSSKDSDFMPDGDHLSAKGAELITDEFMKEDNF